MDIMKLCPQNPTRASRVALNKHQTPCNKTAHALKVIRQIFKRGGTEKKGNEKKQNKT